MAYDHPELLHLALDENTAIEFTPQGASVIGENVAFVIDFRTAKLGLGENQGGHVAVNVTNGLLDVFTPGEKIQPVVADIQARYKVAPTPDLRTATPTPTSTATLIPTATATSTPTDTLPPGKATRTPRPTATPLTIPPPSDPESTQQMIGFGVFVVLVILFGVLINRKRIWKNGQ